MALLYQTSDNARKEDFMKIREKIVAILLASVLCTGFNNAFAYTTFSSETNEEERKVWNYNLDYFESGAPEGEGIWGDSYGNDDVWGIKFGHDYGEGYEINTAVYNAGRGTPQFIENTGGTTPEGYGKNGFVYFYEGGTAYGEIPTDYDFYMVWTSPMDGYVKTDIFGETRWGKTFYTDFSVMHNNIVIDSWSENGAYTGKHSKKLIEVKKGDEIALKVKSQGEGCNFDFTVSEAGTVIIPRSDANKEWAYIQDWIACDGPQTTYWGDSYGTEDIWSISFYNPQTGEEVESQYGNINIYGDGWKNPNNGGYLKIEGTSCYGELGALEGYQVRVNYHVKENGTIIASLDGATVWGNTTNGTPCTGKFILIKNNEEIDSFVTTGNRNNEGTWKNITQKIDVNAGDVVSFAVVQDIGSDAFDIRTKVTSVHGVQVSEDPEMVYKNELGESVSYPVAGGTVSASLPVYNAGKNPINATVLIILYDEDGSLMQIKAERHEGIASGETLSATAELQVEDEPASLKVLVWEEMSTMKPYYRGYNYNFN